ncbi:MAG TPA: ABC transporter ATP-binding protein [Bacteroidetes bacterium]|nr:ABC transporter ATP-binding protein [Bacteroidota bacterium]
MTVILEMRSLSAGYGTRNVLDNVNFKVFENDFIGVIGPNGGGKTTLLKVILGVLKPTGGELIMGDGIDKSTIGYLPQISTGDNSFPLSVLDVVLSGLMIHKSPGTRFSADEKRRAGDLLEELGLKEYSRSQLKELSGGQLQRVFLARAIIGNPRLLLLDEPGSFVDTAFEKSFHDKLKELNGKMTILMVSHDIGTISAHVKSFACVNGSLHYHPSSEITNEQLRAYRCPIQLITHGEVPHTVLKNH